MNKNFDKLQKIVPLIKQPSVQELKELSKLNINSYVTEKLTEKVKSSAALSSIADAAGKVATVTEIIKTIQDILAPEVVEIKPFQINRLLDMEIISEINHHARARIKATLYESDGIKYQEATSENRLEIYRRGELIFTGFLQNISTNVVNHEYILEAEAVSDSILIDLTKKSRSFQDVNMSYGELITEVMGESKLPYLVDEKIKNKKIGNPIIQYNETDWEFIKRVISREKEEIVVNCKSKSVQFGVNDNGNYQELWNECLSVERNISRYKKIKENVEKSISMRGLPVIELSSLKNVFAGDRAALVPPARHELLSEKSWLVNSKYVVRKSRISFEERDVRSYAQLYKREEYIPEKLSNKELAGRCFAATVLKADKTNLKLHLDIDEKQDEGKAYLFPYCTPYSAEGNTGIYFMPEKDDRVLLKINRGDGESGVVYTNIMVNNEKDDAEIKKITAFGNKIYFEKEDIVIAASDDKTLIKISEKEGVVVNSSKELLFETGGNLDLYCEKEMKINGDGGIKMSVGGNVVEASAAGISAKGIKIDWISNRGATKAVKKLTEKLGEVTEVSCSGGDPIDMSTGNFYTDKTDMIIEGKEQLIFSRFYNSMGEWKGTLGNKWQHNYEIALQHQEKGKIVITYGDGKTEDYLEKGNGTIESISNPGNMLTREEGGWLLYLSDGSRYRFDRSGRLTLIERKSGSRIILTHDRDKLVKISNKSGYIELKYEGRYLVKISDMAGRSAEYRYDWNNLTEITDVDGNISRIEYDKNGNIFRMYNGLQIMELENIYDSSNRVVEQKTADGCKLFFKYNDTTLETTFIEKNGEVQIYRKDSMGRVFEREYLSGTEKMKFNEKSQIAEYTDKKGNIYKYEYDEAGNICKEINPLGEVNEYIYDSMGNMIKTVDPEGNISGYFYDEYGNVQATVDPEGRVVRTEYNETGNMTKLIYHNGTEVEFKYDSKFNIVEMRDQDGYITKYEYDSLNRLSSIVKPNGNRISYEYTNSGKVTTVKFGDNSRKEMVYNELGLIIKESDESGNSVKYCYNNSGNVSEIVDEAGNVTKYEYDSMRNISKIIKPDGSEIKYRYNKSNLLQMIEDEEGYCEYMIYDQNGNVTDYADKNENITRYEYDAVNRVSKKIAANGAETGYEYRYDGKLKKVTDALQGMEEFEFNKAGELIAVKKNGKIKNRYKYNETGKVSAEIDDEGNEKIFEYTGTGKVKLVINPDGSREEMEYDGNGNLILVRTASGAETRYEYDKRDRVIRIVDAAGSIRVIEYSLTGKIKCIVDEMKRKTEYFYDKTGKLASVVDAEGGKKEYKYDKRGNLSEVISWNGENSRENPIVMKYIYDRRGMLIEEINPLNNVKSYKYDGNGNIVSMTDQEGINARYEYDAVNNLIKTEYDGEVFGEYSYDLLNRVIKMKKGMEISSFEYDKDGRLKRVRELNDMITEYSWSSNGKKAAITYPDGTVVNYGYNSNGNMSFMRENGEINVKYSYDRAGRLKSKELANGLKTEYEYDVLSRIKKFTVTDKKNQIVDEYSYEYDRAGNKTASFNLSEENKSSFKYYYDKLNRVIEVIDETKAGERYSYDRVGNRTSKEIIGSNGAVISQENYSYDRQNKLLYVDGLKELFGEEVYGRVRFEYDKRGNTTRIKDSSKVLGEYEFSKENLLAKATNRRGEVTSFGYDGAGRRVSMKVKTPKDELVTEYRYVNDPTTPYSSILMRYGSDEIRERYSHGIAHETTERLGKWKDSDKIYSITNELGSTIMETDKTGKAINSYEYDIFGMPSFREDGHNYTGYTYDSSTGFMFAQARYYMPEIGRFISEDKWFGQLEIPMTLHKYIYCYDNPLVYVDRNGKWGTNVHLWESEMISNEVFEANGLKDLQKYSKVIGEGCESVDTNVATMPFIPLRWTQGWHFNANGVGKTGTAEDSRMIHYEECHQKAVKMWKEADEDYNNRKESFWYRIYAKVMGQCKAEKKWLEKRDEARKKSMFELGRGLHPLQDIDAHIDYGEEKFGALGDGIIVAHRTKQDDDEKNGIWNPKYFDNPNYNIYKDEKGVFQAELANPESIGKFSTKVREDNEYAKWESDNHNRTVDKSKKAIERFLRETNQIE